MTLEDKVHATRLLALQRAEGLGNVSAACRELGISRSLFYRWKDRYERSGRDGLHPRRRTTRRGRPHGLSVQDEQAILAMALSHPTCGPRFYALHLARQHRFLSASTVYRALRRMDLGTRQQRLVVLDRHSVQRAGLLTERTRRELQRARRQRRHVEANEPATSVDSKGWGKVGRSRPAMQPARTRLHASSRPPPLSTPCGSSWRSSCLSMKRLTDRGSEFKGAFDEACQSLGIRHTRTKPRHAWTNGFVERLQGTILHEHWRPFAGDPSLLVRSSTGLCNGTWLSPTTIGRIRGTEHEAGYHLTSSGDSLTASPNKETEVSTPFRIWTF